MERKLELKSDLKKSGYGYNDVGFLDTPYRESECFYATNSVTCKERLMNRRKYTLSAISYHKERNNKKQVQFFTEDLNLINKKLRKNISK